LNVTCRKHIPASEAHHTPQGRPSSLTSENPRLTVLVVDDERIIADTLAAILRSNGFGATAVYNGNAAVENARESHPDVLVCDIVLGGESGIETAMQIKSMWPDCRIILISGAHASTEMLEQASAQGHEFEVLAKPFYPTTLIDKLRGAFDQTNEAA
jgi:CheY-like chemotaxis protein